jgi:hypothetical protein
MAMIAHRLTAPSNDQAAGQGSTQLTLRWSERSGRIHAVVSIHVAQMAIGEESHQAVPRAVPESISDIPSEYSLAWIHVRRIALRRPLEDKFLKRPRTVVEARVIYDLLLVIGRDRGGLGCIYLGSVGRRNGRTGRGQNGYGCNCAERKKPSRFHDHIDSLSLISGQEFKPSANPLIFSKIRIWLEHCRILPRQRMVADNQRNGTPTGWLVESNQEALFNRT